MFVPGWMVRLCFCPKFSNPCYGLSGHSICHMEGIAPEPLAGAAITCFASEAKTYFPEGCMQGFDPTAASEEEQVV